MDNEFIDDSFCNICPIVIKKYFDIQEIEYIINEFIPKLTYRIRGFYFVPLKTSYSKLLYIINDNDYKSINSSNKNTVSFRIIKTINPDIYELYIFNEQKTNLEKHSYASIPNIKTSLWLKELTDSKEECIVECKYNKRFKKWVPIKEGLNIDTIIEINI